VSGECQKAAHLSMGASLACPLVFC
jgi:hypothetical protein